MIWKPTIVAALVLACALPGRAVRGDEWDVATLGDVGTATRNTLLHGSEQVHDLAAVGDTPDEDWYKFMSRPRSSFQLVVDGMTGDLRLTGTDVQLLDLQGVFEADAQVTDLGGSLSLAWRNLAANFGGVRHFVRIRGADCGTTCTATDRYRVRFFDTTYSIPRFNNSGTQVTVTTVQNVTDAACDVHYLFQDEGPNLPLGRVDTTLPPRGLHVLNTATVVPNESGSILVLHTCGYGGLSGKAVAVEPATGFTFDTAMVYRPH
jgi:hypothetical protein